MISQFFITRPKFSFVIAILTVLMGLIALPFLPIAQYPEITPPTVSVTASYPGASADIVEETVAIPLEAEINGVEDMIYLSSKSSNDGSMKITVTFAVGTDSDMAAVNVQNRVSSAMSKIPEEVAKQGVVTKKQSTDMLLIVNLYSPNRSFDAIELSNYASIHVRDAIARVPGVGAAEILGALDYGMRIWLKPDRMSSLGITTTDIANAIGEQNIQVPAGQIGQAPSPASQRYQYTVKTQGRLSDIDEFKNIIVRAKSDGSVVRLKDVARVELGSETYNSFGRLNGAPSVVLGVYQLPDANALSVAEEVKKVLEEVSKSFPEDMKSSVLYDTTRFVQASIDEVVKTLFEAIILVLIVVFVFLGNWRSTLIPLLTIPVSLIGTFAFLLAFGFSLNTIVLFGLILAIGLVVDDAIVVVENVQRLMEEGLDPKSATIQAMKEITGPVIATTLVLLAVFVPVGFLPGITGQLYLQFAMAISVSVGLSAVNALTLSPALCASFLKVHQEPDKGILGAFNRYFYRFRDRYVHLVESLLKRNVTAFLILGVIVLLMLGLFKWIPTGFVPNEDQGAFMIDISLPDAASLNRTTDVIAQVEKILLNTPGVTDVLSVAGYSMISGTNAPNTALVIPVLEDWDQREDKSLWVGSIIRKVQAELAALPEASIIAFNMPAIPGLGTTGGFEFVLQDTAGQTPQALAMAMRGLIVAANQDPALNKVFSTFRAEVPQLYLNFDREKAKTLGVPITDVFSTLQTQLGSLYVNDFNKFGRVYRVMLQAESEYRDDAKDIGKLYVRNVNGDMVPLATLTSVNSITGPDTITRYNLFRSASINGEPKPQFSSGQAITAMETLATKNLGEGMSYEWTGMSLQEIEAGSKAPIIFSLALIFVYLFLVAQYESWMIPIPVLLSVPVAIFGALFATKVTGLQNNVYTQIGFVMLIGLSAKNAILIVEFAKHLHEQGKPLVEAAITAAKLRFRAVMMTAFAFILGVVPLVLAEGAGAASRHSLGTAVFGGMLAATLIGILLIPAFYVVTEKIRSQFKK
ncbi:MAG: multidrug efflux RND transporter permease subunit [Gammaproteobacteria bacterium]